MRVLLNGGRSMKKQKTKKFNCQQEGKGKQLTYVFQVQWLLKCLEEMLLQRNPSRRDSGIPS